MRSSSMKRVLVSVATHFRAQGSRRCRDFKVSAFDMHSRIAFPVSYRHMSSGAESSAEKEPVTVVIEPATTKPEQPVVSSRIFKVHNGLILGAT